MAFRKSRIFYFFFVNDFFVNWHDDSFQVFHHSQVMKIWAAMAYSYLKASIGSSLDAFIAG